MAAIEIPATMRPRDGRFGAGPSKVRPEALAALVAAGPTYLGTSHRQDPVRRVVAKVRTGLRELFDLPDGYEVVLGIGGASAFWDIATFCLIETVSEHLSFGEFSAKFAAAAVAAPHLGDPLVISSPPGTRPDARADERVDLYAFTHNETSTGVMMPLQRPRHENGSTAAGLVVVDGTSAAGGMRFDPEETDVYFFSPQKCFGADAGLWLAVCSPDALERVGRLAATGRYVPAFLDLSIAIENSRLDQTYNTPPLVSLWLMAEQLDWFAANGGLEFAAGRADRSSEIVYSWAESCAVAAPFVAKPDDRSRVVATIDFAEGTDAAGIAATLRANGIVDTEPYRKLGRNQLRISTFPTVDPEDVAALVSCIDYVLERLD
jgi:phosphoserine aminotransferase